MDAIGQAELPVVKALEPPLDPLECCERLAALPYRLFLDSAATHGRLGRFSFLMADPIVVLRAKGPRVEQWSTAQPWHVLEDDLLTAARRLLGRERRVAVPGLPPFQGGVAGYIGYDWGRTLESVPGARFDDLGLPDAILGFYDWVLAWDHESGRNWLISTGRSVDSDLGGRARAMRRLAAVEAQLSAAGGHRPAAPAGPPPSAPPPWVPTTPVDEGQRPPLRSTFSAAEYRRAVDRVRSYIAAGDIFQANVSQRFEAPLTGDAWTFYRRLRNRNGGPFSAFFDLTDAAVLSTSPERFLRVDASGQVETRPIKGTRPRGVGPEHDAALGPALIESEKDRAENLMIVDLMRNDLSRVCRPGTVRVPELFALEHYATVHHLVSTVVGTLAPGLDAFDLMRAAFPGGSITGAPKIRAMEIIAELEPTARGVYCGTIGYWSLTGESDTNIAIRTAVARDGRVTFSAGGGVVADSHPEHEYRETLDKARGFIETVDEAFA